ncbi:MAG: metallophosphoesterase, partial [Bacteroidetes bacterium]|nr:metallophosphoesterase [Bacteroidota bacterium]
KIVHISDIHVGSFISEKPLANAVKLIGDQKPDIIFFTGDLINNITAETNGFFHVLKNIQAPLGVLSVLGNHDYGFYNVNYSEKERLKNFEMLKKFQKELGWKLLLNEHHRIRKGNDEIAVIGVENWSSFLHFPRFGNLERALEGTDNVPVKILLTHDPTHWSGEVIGKDHNINLTLSGHTHGMQMGIEVPGFRWSPVQYIYEHWAGLYSNRNRFLYVNRGLGFIGYMGRLGILPEITVFNIFAE